MDLLRAGAALLRGERLDDGVAGAAAPGALAGEGLGGVRVPGAVIMGVGVSVGRRHSLQFT